MSEIPFDAAKLNGMLMSDITKPVKTVYIDLQYLQDLYLGTMVLLTSTINPDKEKFNHIVSNISKYNSRVVYDHAGCFPDLHLTDESLREYMNDPQYRNVILCSSPATTLTLEFSKIHNFIRTRNVHHGYTGPISYWINTFPITTCDENDHIVIKEKILYFDPENYLANLFDLHGRSAEFLETLQREYVDLFQQSESWNKEATVRVALTSTPFTKLSKESLIQPDAFFIYDLEGVDDPSKNIYDYLVNQKLIEDCPVFAPERLWDRDLIKKLPYLTQQQRDGIFAATMLTTSMYFALTYLNPNILVEE